MAYEIINLVLTIIGLIIALGGGIAGFVAVYILWKKSKDKLKIITTKANYFLEKKNLLVFAVINLQNDKDTPQSVTDLVASIRFDKDKKDKIMPKGFSVSPVHPVEFPISIPAHSSYAINAKFVFPEVELYSIDRAGEARFMGIYENTPVLVADERDFEKKWDQLPLLLRLDLHINGSTSLKTIAGAHKIEKASMISGTFNSVDVGKIQHEFIKEGKI